MITVNELFRTISQLPNGDIRLQDGQLTFHGIVGGLDITFYPYKINNAVIFDIIIGDVIVYELNAETNADEHLDKIVDYIITYSKEEVELLRRDISKISDIIKIEKTLLYGALNE